MGRRGHSSRRRSVGNAFLTTQQDCGLDRGIWRKMFYGFLFNLIEVVEISEVVVVQCLAEEHFHRACGY